MPKKKQNETQEEQSARFHAEVERLVAAGELNPTEADSLVSKLLNDQKLKRRPGQGGV